MQIACQTDVNFYGITTCYNVEMCAVTVADSHRFHQKGLFDICFQVWRVFLLF